MRMRLCLVLVLFGALIVNAADPTTPMFWSAKQTKEIDGRIPAKLDKTRGLATERLMDSAFILYREGASEAEIHTKQADFIFVHEGDGAILVGGQIIDGKPSGTDEIRGKSIDGGTKYAVSAGDTLYVPANMVHQFLVEPGKHFSATIVKITPKQ
jgi:mannose-6-phosphate isomerase-like protein (cupin superfamily)